jgi:hypothetical protein
MVFLIFNKKWPAKIGTDLGNPNLETSPSEREREREGRGGITGWWGKRRKEKREEKNAEEGLRVWRGKRGEGKEIK